MVGTAWMTQKDQAFALGKGMRFILGGYELLFSRTY